MDKLHKNQNVSNAQVLMFNKLFIFISESLEETSTLLHKCNKFRRRAEYADPFNLDERSAETWICLF